MHKNDGYIRLCVFYCGDVSQQYNAFCAIRGLLLIYSFRNSTYSYNYAVGGCTLIYPRSLNTVLL